MRRYWLSPEYWLARHYMKQIVALIEARPWLMDSPRARNLLAGAIRESERRGWLDHKPAFDEDRDD